MIIQDNDDWGRQEIGLGGQGNCNGIGNAQTRELDSRGMGL